MGAYVSVSQCKSAYNIDVNCTINLNGTEEERHIGKFMRGEVPPNGDVAGIGIVSMFIGVTSFTLALSIVDLLWAFAKTAGCKTRLTTEQRRKTIGRRCSGLSFSRLLEALVQSCSDQQAFTGGAYAIALRYYNSCSITAYHYSIVANMMLLTCATHLMSIVVVKNYWQYPWLAAIRVGVITGVFMVTGLLLANQNASDNVPFPSSVPRANETDMPIFALAACFQGKEGAWSGTLGQSFEPGNARDTFLFTTPGNRIEGWNFYLIILLCYGAAIIVEFTRFVRRSEKRLGIVRRVFRRKTRGSAGRLDTLLRGTVKFIYGLYLVGCLAISGVTVGFEANYMLRLRRWAHNSEWLEVDEYGMNEEQDWSSFGQLVPIFLGLLTLFTFADVVSKMGRRGNPEYRVDQDEKDPESGSAENPVAHYKAVPSSYSLPRHSTASFGQTVDPSYRSSTQMQDLQSGFRPTMSHRDTMASGAPLLGSPESTPYSPSRHDSASAFTLNRQTSDMSAYASYFPSQHTESPSLYQGPQSPQSPQSARASIARRPVGASSMDLGQGQRPS